MEPLLPLRPQIRRQVNLLSTSKTRLSLMSIVIPSLSRQATVAAVLAAATPIDTIGVLSDGSIGVFAFRSPGPSGDAGIDERFLPRLQAALRGSFAPAFTSDVKLWFRSVHRWASEMGDADDMIDALYAASSRVVGLGPQPNPLLQRLPAARGSYYRTTVWP